MNARDLYKTKGRFTTSIAFLQDKSMPEVDLLRIDSKLNKAVRIKIHGECITNDDEWRLMSVFFGQQPFMIIQYYEVDGVDKTDTYHKRFITDWKRYGQAVQYLRLLSGETEDVVADTDDLPELTEFCGLSLEAVLEIAKNTPKKT
jgi:hypothetical protein